MITISPSEDDIFTVLRTFLLSVVPAGVDAFQGQQNRVPEPSATDFMVMWPLMRPRLATNVDEYFDTAFMASVAGQVMTVTEMLIGSIRVGATLLGVDVAPGTTILSQQSGPDGGAGTYTVSVPQNLSERKLASGMLTAMQESEVVIQVDMHTAKLSAGGDLAATVATMFRDAYAVDMMTGLNPAITPLYSDDPRQAPFLNGEQQYEIKWTLDLHLQVNQTVTGIPLQFFDAADLELVNVDAEYPAS